MIEPGTRPQIVKSILHPTDFSESSTTAFAHALALAVRRQTTLTLLHVGVGDDPIDRWIRFPSVRATLERWGLLSQGSDRSAVFEQLGVKLGKVSLDARRPLPVILKYLEERPADLLVLATAGKESLSRWLHGSVAEPLARRSRTMTLFVPAGTRGFVSLSDGQASVHNILLPLDRKPDPMSAIDFATRAAEVMGDGSTTITALHARPGGKAAGLGMSALPEGAGWTWNRLMREGPPIETILETAGKISADLIVMATSGHQGIVDALRGSTTEQVVRKAPCPILAVPAR
jgi:nucleotide-binding universal stress UspA family protein